MASRGNSPGPIARGLAAQIAALETSIEELASARRTLAGLQRDTPANNVIDEAVRKADRAIVRRLRSTPFEASERSTLEALVFEFSPQIVRELQDSNTLRTVAVPPWSRLATHADEASLSLFAKTCAITELLRLFHQASREEREQLRTAIELAPRVLLWWPGGVNWIEEAMRARLLSSAPNIPFYSEKNETDGTTLLQRQFEVWVALHAHRARMGNIAPNATAQLVGPMLLIALQKRLSTESLLAELLPLCSAQALQPAIDQCLHILREPFSTLSPYSISTRLDVRGVFERISPTLVSEADSTIVASVRNVYVPRKDKLLLQRFYRERSPDLLRTLENDGFFRTVALSAVENYFGAPLEERGTVIDYTVNTKGIANDASLEEVLALLEGSGEISTLLTAILVAPEVSLWAPEESARIGRALRDRVLDERSYCWLFGDRKQHQHTLRVDEVALGSWREWLRTSDALDPLEPLFALARRILENKSKPQPLLVLVFGVLFPFAHERKLALQDTQARTIQLFSSWLSETELAPSKRIQLWETLEDLCKAGYAAQQPTWKLVRAALVPQFIALLRNRDEPSELRDYVCKQLEELDAAVIDALLKEGVLPSTPVPRIDELLAENKTSRSTAELGERLLALLPGVARHVHAEDVLIALTDETVPLGVRITAVYLAPRMVRRVAPERVFRALDALLHDPESYPLHWPPEARCTNDEPGAREYPCMVGDYRMLLVLPELALTHLLLAVRATLPEGLTAAEPCLLHALRFAIARGVGRYGAHRGVYGCTTLLEHGPGRAAVREVLLGTMRDRQQSFAKRRSCFEQARFTLREETRAWVPLALADPEEDPDMQAFLRETAPAAGLL